MLPNKPRDFECAVINLGDVKSNGTHWTCYIKQGKNKLYFDSYGDATPPQELVNYLGADNIVYNTDRIQDFVDPPICGHLCLEVLRQTSNNVEWKNIMRDIKRNKYAYIFRLCNFLQKT